MLNKALAVLALCFLLPSVAVAEQYICIGEESVGFSYNKMDDKWQSTRYTTDEKFVISNKGKLVEISGIAEGGKRVPGSYSDCRFDDYDHLECDGPFGQFKFNKRNGRFLLSLMVGYWDVHSTNEGNIAPYLTIGVCSPF